MNGPSRAPRAPSIARQALAVLREQEEARCRRLEADLASKPGESRKPVKRREVAEPTVRLGPRALCQDPEVLKCVKEVDYLLSDTSFRTYCRERGVLHVAGLDGSARWQFFLDASLSEADFFNRSDLRSTAEAAAGRGVDHAAMRLQWEIVCYGRAVLQDCWELFQADREPS